MATQITKKLDWSSWFRGAWSAIITGATTSMVVGTIDPGDFNLHNRKLYAMFAIPALISFAKYMAMHPAPDLLPQEVVANVETSVTVKPVDPNQPETTITSSTPVTGPSLVPDKEKS